MALYAVHLPLDIHPQYGNNASLAQNLRLQDQTGFAPYRGVNIGIKGRLDTPLPRDQIIQILFADWEENTKMLPFGPEEIKTVGILSGGGTRQLEDAIRENLDLYITGDSSHMAYHQSLEAGINVLFAGHYMTELSGVRAIEKKVHREKNLETVFIDVPTGL